MKRTIHRKMKRAIHQTMKRTIPQIMKRAAVCVLLILVFVSCCGFRALNDQNCLDTENMYVVEDNGSDVIVIGDSRIYQMRLATGNQEVNWLAACGTGYDWFEKCIVPVVDKEYLRGKTILIEYGVNDVWFGGGADVSKDKWLPFFQKKAQSWIRRGATVELLLVTPTRYNPANEEIAKYNSMMVDSLPDNIKLIYVNDAVDFEYIDDIHYTNETYQAMFDAIGAQMQIYADRKKK